MGSVAEKTASEKPKTARQVKRGLVHLPWKPDVTGGLSPVRSYRGRRENNMDKKEIDSPKMTLNFLIWMGGVFMLLLFAFLAHFVWKVI